MISRFSALCVYGRRFLTRHDLCRRPKIWAQKPGRLHLNLLTGWLCVGNGYQGLRSGTQAYT